MHKLSTLMWDDSEVVYVGTMLPLKRGYALIHIWTLAVQSCLLCSNIYIPASGSSHMSVYLLVVGFSSFFGVFEMFGFVCLFVCLRLEVCYWIWKLENFTCLFIFLFSCHPCPLGEIDQYSICSFPNLSIDYCETVQHFPHTTHLCVEPL